MISVDLASLAVCGDGYGIWREASKTLGGHNRIAWHEPTAPKGGPMAPGERRRASALTRLVVFTAHEAVSAVGLNTTGLCSVFASSSGDLPIIDRICGVLADEEDISPTDFHNSVHNAAAGYWSIASRCVDPSISISAFDDSFGSGLLEASTYVMANNAPVLLISYDAPAPDPLSAARRIDAPFVVALVLCPNGATSILATLSISAANGETETVLDHTELEQIRLGNPAARSLPLVLAAAHRSDAKVVLPCSPPLQVNVQFPS